MTGARLLPLLFALVTAPALSATLRPFATVEGAVVHLSDLWDGLDAGTDRPLGPAPLPGARFAVESAQLVAIARQFGIDWHTASPADRAVVARDGRPMAREAVLALLRPALLAAGAPQSVELDVPAFAPLLLPNAGATQPEIEQLDYDPVSGRFSASVAAAIDGAEPVRTRIAGTAMAMMDVVVLARRVAPGTMLDPTDLATAHVRLVAAHVPIVELAEQAHGMALRHTVVLGQPIPLADLVRPPAVTRGALVAIELDGPGITLSAQVQAMDDGAVGERIRVLNSGSRAVLSAVIDSPGQVHVMANSSPLVPAAGSRPPVTFAEALPR